MIEEAQDVEEQESSPVEDEEVESSTTEETQDEEATSEKAPEKEPPFHEHPRWQEVQEQRKQAEDSAAKAKAEAEYYRGLAEASKPKENEPDPYAGMDAETKAFWENVDKRAEAKALSIVDKARKEATEPLRQQLQASNKLLGNVIAKDFLKEHPELSKESPEMKLITKKAESEVRFGKDINDALDDAYRVVMFDKVGQMAAEKEKKKTQSQTKKKLAANVETKTVSRQSLPSKSNNLNITADDMGKTAKELGMELPW